MATPPMDPAKVAEARDLVARFGTVSEASRASGIPYSTLEKRYKRDPAIAASMGFGGRRAMQSMTFDKQDGLVLRAFDPVEREAVSFTRG